MTHDFSEIWYNQLMKKFQIDLLRTHLDEKNWSKVPFMLILIKKLLYAHKTKTHIFPFLSFKDLRFILWLARREFLKENETFKGQDAIFVALYLSTGDE